MADNCFTIVFCDGDDFSWCVMNFSFQHMSFHLVDIAAGLVYVISNIGYTTLTFILFSSSTVATNVFITSLIVGRLLHHRNYLQQALGPKHRSPYLKIVVLFVESASSVVAFNIAVMFIIITRPENGYYILILVQLTVHIYVSSCIFAAEMIFAYSMISPGYRTFYDYIQGCL